LVWKGHKKKRGDWRRKKKKKKNKKEKRRHKIIGEGIMCKIHNPAPKGGSSSGIRRNSVNSLWI
jgi:hypothetical protein